MRSTSPAPTAPAFATEIADTVSALNAARSAWRTRQPSRGSVARFPSPSGLARVVEHLSAALFPARLGGFRGDVAREDDFVAEQLGSALTLLREEVASELDYWQAESDQLFEPDQPDAITRLFAATLADIRALVDADVEAAFVGDPAARSADEILISYPGALAILHHRIAHQLHTLGAVIVARVISELANARTGIDIHPGATIGPSFFIDHGTGVVIGETTTIGKNVKLYQHVTLGAKSFAIGEDGTLVKGIKRHPDIGDRVVVYSGATILGGQTQIGNDCVIGGSVWLTHSVPAGKMVLSRATVMDPPLTKNLEEDSTLDSAML